MCPQCDPESRTEMKINIKLLAIGILLLVVPQFALAETKENLLGKFYVSRVSGRVECVSESRIFDLRKGDVVLARGARLRSFPGGNATLVLSNETTLFLDEKTAFKINKFEQQPFLPNNNLLIEPSNSDTLVTVGTGRIVISTPQLLSGTRLIFETEHSRVSVLNGQPGGEKAFIEVTEKQTHFALVTGAASIQVRGADGNFTSIGTRIKSSEQAYIRYTLTGQITLASSAEDTVNGAAAAQPGAKAPGPVPTQGAVVGGGSTGSQPGFTSNSPIVTIPGEAVVLTVVGEATSQSGSDGAVVPLVSGTKLAQGAIITTSTDAEVYLQPFPGALSDIKSDARVVIEKLATATSGGTVQKQTALLDLKRGTLVSVLDPDPAKRKIDNYGVRTPNGIATAHGTSFSVSVTANDFSVAATADSVTFVTPSGTSYSIAAGNITITSASGQAQPPIPLSQAVAENPAIARVLRTAVNTVSTIVQNNIGSLPSASAINLISQVVGVAAAAMPTQASRFATEAMSAVNSPGASTAGNTTGAAASVTAATVSAVPAQAAQVAAALTRNSPSQATTIAAAAGSSSPSQSAQVATAVLQVSAGQNPGQSISALTQAASSIAAAMSVSVPAQAGPVSGALMQAIAQANPQAGTAALTQQGATLAAAVTASTPAQAGPVAAAVMQQITVASPVALSSTAVSQTAAALGAAVTTTAPSQAVPVATALMQFIQQNLSASGGTASGLLAATISAASPGSAAAITTAVAVASGQSEATVTQGALASASSAAATVTASAGSVASGSQASQSSAASSAAVSAAASVAADTIATITSGTSTSSTASSAGVVQGTSIIVEKLAGGNLVDVANNLSGSTTTVTFGTTNSGDSSGTATGTTGTTITATPTTPNTLPTDTTSTSVTPGT